MSAEDWVLREPSGTVHVTEFVPDYRASGNKVFVLPRCWSTLFMRIDRTEAGRAGENARTRLRRQLKPVRSHVQRVTCVYCIGLGLE